jgi:hypothetical protein
MCYGKCWCANNAKDAQEMVGVKWWNAWMLMKKIEDGWLS